jgi:hypothetical protein
MLAPKNRKTASRRPFRNPIRCFDQAAAVAAIIRFLRRKQTHHAEAGGIDVVAD